MSSTAEDLEALQELADRDPDGTGVALATLDVDDDALARLEAEGLVEVRDGTATVTDAGREALRPLMA